MIASSQPRLPDGTWRSTARAPRPSAIASAGTLTASSSTPRLSPHHREAARDAQHLPGHVRRLVGGQVGDCARHVIRPAEPSRLLLSNADGAAVDSGAEVLARLVSQVTSPVRFDACLATMRELGVTAAIELPPAGALAGLAKREWKGHTVEGRDAEVLALSGPADLDRARELIDAERGRAEAEHLPDWRVVVSPVRGTVSPADIAEGSHLPAGTALGCIRSRREEVRVSAGYDGVLAEWLVHEGDLVDAGDPLARLYPEVSPS